MPSFELANDLGQTVQIKVIGVGGGGGNAVNRMVQSDVQGAEFIAVNTDKQILEVSAATHKIQIGERTTRGMGAGGVPAVGAKAAEEDREKITDILRGADMVFVTAGMGGGTGTGAAPIIAEISKEMGILTIGVVTKPFRFEREHRMKSAVEGIKRLAACVDSLIVIPNEHLRNLSPDGKLPMRQAFALADQVLVEGVRNISELIKVPAYINLDFADVSAVMRGAGYAHLGVGRAQGEDKARRASEQAVSSPLLETTIDGADGLIINIRASEDIDLDDVEAAVDMITETAHPQARVIWGILLDEEMDNEIAVTVIATGFDPKKLEAEPKELSPRQEIKIDLPDFVASPPTKFEPPPLAIKKEPERQMAPATAVAVAAATKSFNNDMELASLDDLVPPLRNSFGSDDAGTDVDRDHDTVIGMLYDKFQRERSKRNN